MKSMERLRSYGKTEVTCQLEQPERIRIKGYELNFSVLFDFW